MAGPLPRLLPTTCLKMNLKLPQSLHDQISFFFSPVVFLFWPVEYFSKNIKKLLLFFKKLFWKETKYHILSHFIETADSVLNFGIYPSSTWIKGVSVCVSLYLRGRCLELSFFIKPKCDYSKNTILQFLYLTMCSTQLLMSRDINLILNDHVSHPFYEYTIIYLTNFFLIER